MRLGLFVLLCILAFDFAAGKCKKHKKVKGLRLRDTPKAKKAKSPVFRITRSRSAQARTQGLNLQPPAVQPAAPPLGALQQRPHRRPMQLAPLNIEAMTDIRPGPDNCKIYLAYEDRGDQDKTYKVGYIESELETLKLSFMKHAFRSIEGRINVDRLIESSSCYNFMIELVPLLTPLLRPAGRTGNVRNYVECNGPLESINTAIRTAITNVRRKYPLINFNEKEPRTVNIRKLKRDLPEDAMTLGAAKRKKYN